MKLGRIGRRAVRNPNASGASPRPTPPSLDAVSRPPYLIDGADPMEPMPDEVTDLLNESDADTDFVAAEWELHRAAHEDTETCDCAEGREEFGR